MRPPMGPPPGMGGHRGPRSFLTEEEKQNMPKVSWGLIKRILSYLKPYIFQFILVFLGLGISAVLGLMPSVVTGKIVDEIVADNRSMQKLIELLVLAFGILAASQIISVLEQYINSWISQMIIRDMRNQMYNHLQYMSHAFFTREKQGDIITRMNSDINGVGTVVSGTLTSVVSNFLTLGTSVFYLFYTDWRLAIIGIAIIPVFIIPTRLVGRRRWALATVAQEKRDNLNQHIDETLSVSGSMLVKLFTREKKEYKKFVDINKEVTDITVKEHRTGSWFHVFMGLFMQLAPLLIYFAGGYIIMKTDSKLSVGDITVVVSLVNRLNMPVRSLLNIQVDFTRSLALFTRIFEYFDKKADVVSPENPKEVNFENSSIEFKNVHFAYDRGPKILKGVDFLLPGGKMYAIVGSSGAGKSTVVSLIPRLYDAVEGEVKVAGVNIKDIDLTSLRENIGMVSQDTYLFNGTIMENLLYAKDDATREEIESACKIANIHDFIVSLPQGYDTQVGNRGLKLSGGEKQRISIARVILKDPEILILDEATSSLDSISESLIQDALDKVMIGRTSLIIAHRLTTVLAADRIMVLNEGKIQESGTHEELMVRSGRYRELFETQFRKVLEIENFQKS